MNQHYLQLIFAYQNHLKVLHRSKATIAAYMGTIKKFLSYLSDTGIHEIKEVTTETIKKYQLEIATIKDETGKPRYCAASIFNGLRNLKTFFAYLENSNQIVINPAEYMKIPKSENKLPRVVLTAKEMEKLLNQPNLSFRKGIRDRTVLEVLYSTGIRLAEVCSLTIYDVDLQQGLLRVKGKGSKERVVPLGKHAVKLLKEYLTNVRPHYTKPKKHKRNKTGVLRTNILFVGVMGYPVNSYTISRLITQSLKTAKIKKNVTAHTFRHTMATDMIKNGADIRIVQQILGHSDLKTTQIYTKVAIVDLKKTHQKHHPAERTNALRAKLKG